LILMVFSFLLFICHRCENDSDIVVWIMAYYCIVFQNDNLSGVSHILERVAE
jgi:hypothetical protein